MTLIDPVIDIVFKTENIALILAVAACVVCGLFHLKTRRDDRQERSESRKLSAEERATLYNLIHQNTEALHSLRNTLSAISGKIL